MKRSIRRRAGLRPRAYPGEEGVCVIYGHRNRNHFQVLKDIDFGDTITVTLADGTVLSYTVESIRILDSDEELRIPLISGQHLYPLRQVTYQITNAEFVTSCLGIIVFIKLSINVSSILQIYIYNFLIIVVY